MKQRNNPDLEDIIEGALEGLMYNFHCHRIGIINTFDPATQKASIQIVDKAVIENIDGEQLKEYSILEDCPVFVAKGQDGGITYPIKIGDTCLILFNDRDIDNWDESGQVQRTNTVRAHDLSDGIAIVGIRNQVNKIGDYNNNATEINYKTTKISLDSKVGISNDSQQLKTLIDNFIDIITNLMTVDPVTGLQPIDPTTATALTTLKTNFDNLLKTN